MPINKYGISVYSANDPDYLEWIHPEISERPPYLHPKYRTGRWTMIDGVKVYSLRKVENGVHHGSQIYHNSESGNNRLYIIGAQVREQRKQAALIHGEDSEQVRKIGRETFKIYRQQGFDNRTYGTPLEFNGYDLKSKWKIIDYEAAEHNEEVLELTGDRTGNTIDQDLKFHFTRFEGNNEEALKDVERYKYYFKLASVRYNPKVDKATHRNSRRFWEGLRDEEQRNLENELLHEYDNIEVEIPQADKVEVDVPEAMSDAESEVSVNTVIDVSMDANTSGEQEVMFSKSFSDDSIKSLVSQTPIIDLRDFVQGSAPQKMGVLASSLILGKVVSEAKESVILKKASNDDKNSVVVRKRTRIPKDIMNAYNPPSSSSNPLLSSLSSKTATTVAASNEAQGSSLPIIAEEETFPPPPKFFTPPPQTSLVTAPVSVDFELSETAPTITPPTPFLNNKLNDQLAQVRECNKGLDEFSEDFKFHVSSTLAKRKTPPPVMLSLAEPEFRSITEDPNNSDKEVIRALEEQLEEYHVAAQIDAETIDKLETANRRHKKFRFESGNKINTLRVAGSAISLIINDSLSKFKTPRFDMNLSINESHSSTKTCPQVSIVARKADKSANDCMMSPKCITNSSNRCTHCELQWITSIVSVLWNDAMNTTGLSDAEFLIDHFDPCAVNGPPPDYFSKPGELSLSELNYTKLVVKRANDSSPFHQQTQRRRIDSEEVLSADDSVDRESLEIKREVVETYRVEAERSVWSDSEQFDDASDAESTEPEVSDLPFSDNGEMC